MGDGTMRYRVVTFQSREVASIILDTGVYYADKSKAREGSFDDIDFEVCGGKCPIWVFQHPVLKYNTITIRPLSDLLEMFRCEMSINSLDGLRLIELSLDEQPPKGIAHNDSSLCCIIPVINLNQVLSISTITKTSWYMYNITPYYSAYGALFREPVKCTQEAYGDDENKLVSLSKFKSAYEYYL